MNKKDAFLDIAQSLNNYMINQNGVLEEIQRSLKMLGTNSSISPLESAFLELDKINSFKSLLPKTNIDSPILQVIRQANESISHLSLSPQLQLLLNETIKIPDSWKKQFADISSMSMSIEPALLRIQSEIARISEISILAERTLSLIDFPNIFDELNASSALKKMARETNSSFLDSYSNLFQSFKAEQLGIFSHAPVMSTIPPIEFYLNTRLIRPMKLVGEESPEDTAISHELIEETLSDVELLLGELDPKLIDLWKGAGVVYDQSYPDAIRHFSVSSRELLTQIIHRLSPDEKVKTWSSSPDHFHNGRPTRKARLLYICRELNHPPFDDFLIKDIDAVLAGMQVFEEGTHAIDPRFTRSQIDLLKSRLESSIRFLIRTYKETKNQTEI